MSVLRGVLLCLGCTLLHFAQEAGANEGIEAEVDLALVCVRVDGCFGFAFLQLRVEAVLPITERGEVCPILVLYISPNNNLIIA